MRETWESEKRYRDRYKGDLLKRTDLCDYGGQQVTRSAAGHGDWGELMVSFIPSPAGLRPRKLTMF